MKGAAGESEEDFLRELTVYFTACHHYTKYTTARFVLSKGSEVLVPEHPNLNAIDQYLRDVWELQQFCNVTRKTLG